MIFSHVCKKILPFQMHRLQKAWVGLVNPAHVKPIKEDGHDVDEVVYSDPLELVDEWLFLVHARARSADARSDHNGKRWLVLRFGSLLLLDSAQVSFSLKSRAHDVRH